MERFQHKAEVAIVDDKIEIGWTGRTRQQGNMIVLVVPRETAQYLLERLACCFGLDAIADA